MNCDIAITHENKANSMQLTEVHIIYIRHVISAAFFTFEVN